MNSIDTANESNCFIYKKMYDKCVNINTNVCFSIIHPYNIECVKKIEVLKDKSVCLKNKNELNIQNEE